jgi:O-antigen ligase
MNGRWRTLCGLGAGTLGGVALSAAGGLFSPIMGLALVLGTLVAGRMFLFPDFAYLLSVVVIPIERLGRFADDRTMPVVSLMRIVGTTALASFLVHAALKKWRLYVSVPLLLYAGYVGVCVATIFYAPEPVAARVHTATVIGNLLFLFLVLNAVRDWQMAKLSIHVWLGVSILIGMYQIYDWYFGSAVEEIGTLATRFSTTFESVSEQTLGSVRQAMGTTSGAAAYGINLLMTLPFLWWCLRVATTPWQRFLSLFGLGVIGYNLLLTNSRAVILFALVCTVLCLARRLVSVTTSRLLVGIGTVLGGLYFLPEAVWVRALNPDNYLPQNSYNLRGRFELWKAALRLLEDYWLTGVGGANIWILPKYIDWDESDAEAVMSHNEYLQTFVDTGIVGWIFFMAFIGLTLAYAIRAASRYRMVEGETDRYWFAVACQITCVTVYLFGLQVDVFHNPLKGWWLVAGLAGVMFRLSHAETARAG